MSDQVTSIHVEDYDIESIRISKNLEKPSIIESVIKSIFNVKI